MSSLEKCQKVLQDKRSALSDDSYNQPTSFGGFRRDDIEPVLVLNSNCLGPLKHYPKTWNGLNSFFIFNQADETNPYYQRYLDYILSPDVSPWKVILRAQPDQDRDFINKYGFVLTDLNFPANFVVNFLTAFRVPYERKANARLWCDLVDDGVSPGCAIWLAAAILSSLRQAKYDGGEHDKTTREYTLSDGGHYPFSPQSNSFDAPDRINRGEPSPKQLSQNLFCQSTNYTPCNSVWGDKWSEYPALWDMNLVARRYIKKATKSGSSRMFSDPGPVDPPILYDTVINFCKALDKKEVRA